MTGEAEPRQRVARFYGQPSDHPALEWSWVQSQLAEAGTYWIVARNEGPPHPRPVWGLWIGQELYLSIGTPTITRTLLTDPVMTVHLESGVDVVIVEGVGVAGDVTGPEVLDAYKSKYDWEYDAATYGNLTRIRPTSIVAWRAAGPAGRDSFQETGSWVFDWREAPGA